MRKAGYLEVSKSTDARGTWVENAFQLDLRDVEPPSSGGPLPIPLFSDIHPYHCVPHCGVYGLSEYHMALPAALVLLPLGQLTQSPQGLPDKLLELVKLYHSQGNSVDVFFLIHSCPSFANAVDPMERSVNLMFHLWALQGMDQSLQQQEIHTGLLMGGYCPVGVAEIPPICEAEELNGLPLGHMGRRILYMHDGHLSPNNAQVRLSVDHSLHSLFTVAHDSDQKRTACSFHLIPSTQDAEERLVKEAGNLGQLLQSIENADYTHSKLHSTTSKNFIVASCS